LRRDRAIIVSGKKAINITYSECVSVALFAQYDKRICRIILSYVACPAVTGFPHYLANGTIFGEKVIKHKMCVIISSMKYV